MPRTALALSIFAALVLAGCSSLSSAVDPVSTVKGGTLDQPYNTATVGKAFEGTFAHPAWRSFQTPKGQTIVEFKGDITIGALDDAGLGTKAYFGDPSPVMTACPQQAAAFKEVARDLFSARWKAAKGALAPCVLPVEFQFTMTANDKTFTLSYVDGSVFGMDEPNKILSFIYH